MNFRQLHTGKPAELSEMQNYAYWNSHFPPGKHDLHYRFTVMIRGERENIFNCTRLRFEQHKHGEKNNKFTDLHVFIRSLLRQTKASENC